MNLMTHSLQFMIGLACFAYFINSKPVCLVQMETLCTTITETLWDAKIATNSRRSNLTTQSNHGTFNKEHNFLYILVLSFIQSAELLVYKVIL